MDPYSEKAFRIVLVGGAIMVAWCLLWAMLSISLTDWAHGSYFKTELTGFGTADLRETAPGDAGQITAMVDNASAVYRSEIEWGDITTIAVTFNIFGAPASSKKWLGHRNQFVVKAAGSDNGMVYRATAIEGDFVGEVDLILRTEAFPGPNGEITEASIKLDSSEGKSVLDLRVINKTTGKPVTAFELDAVGNFTFEQYLLLNMTAREKLTEEDFCESLDRILPRDFSGVYIAPHGKQLTPGADLIPLGASEAVETSTNVGRFAEEQELMDAYREAHPEEFEEE